MALTLWHISGLNNWELLQTCFVMPTFGDFVVLNTFINISTKNCNKIIKPSLVWLLNPTPPIQIQIIQWHTHAHLHTYGVTHMHGPQYVLSNCLCRWASRWFLSVQWKQPELWVTVWLCWWLTDSWYCGKDNAGTLCMCCHPRAYFSCTE